MTEYYLLKPQLVGEKLQIGPTKTYELIASGELESVRIGRCLRVPADALDRYVERLRSSSDPAQVFAATDEISLAQTGSETTPSSEKRTGD